MAPGNSQKGTNKKNLGSAPKASRTSTPAPAPANLPPQHQYDPEFLVSRVITLRDVSIEDLAYQGSTQNGVPELRAVDSILQKLDELTKITEIRSSFYDRGMRHLVEERKRRPVEEPEPIESRRKTKRKKGLDSLASGDTNQERSSPMRENTKRKHQRDRSASSSLSPVAAKSPSAMEVDEKDKKEKKISKDQKDKVENIKEEDEGSSEEEEEEVARPKREVPAHQTFGDDPSTFPDPTVYEIRDITPDMTEKQKADIYSVTVFPHSDLADLIAGDPPDKDFSVGKATNQIGFTTFSSWVDPFFRAFTEEDLGFLRERGERLSPFMMPARGKRHYSEIWAEEDGAMSIDSPQHGRDTLPANQTRGNIENMTDSLAETDQLSIGPLASRLLSALRPENRAQPSDDKPTSNGMTNGDLSLSGDLNLDDPFAMPALPDMALPASTFMAESATEAWKKATHPKLDYAQVDERLKQELRYLGLLPEEGFEPNYNDHLDDEVAARLRILQARLKEQILINGARKAKLMELTKERMAHQEYQTILEDLDSQVQGAYLKRTRTMGKSKKNKRPGGAGGGSHMVGGAAGTARPGIGDLTKTLMERRKRWIDTIGPVFDAESLTKVPREADGDTSIFKTAETAELMKKEQEIWDEEVDDE